MKFNVKQVRNQDDAYARVELTNAKAKSNN